MNAAHIIRMKDFNPYVYDILQALSELNTLEDSGCRNDVSMCIYFDNIYDRMYNAAREGLVKCGVENVDPVTVVEFMTGIKL